MLASFADKALAQQLERYATAIGLAFQVQDDILDIEGDSETIGKTVGSDLTADKSTYPKLLGLEGAKQKAQELYEMALAELKDLPLIPPHFMRWRNLSLNEKANAPPKCGGN